MRGSAGVSPSARTHINDFIKHFWWGLHCSSAFYSNVNLFSVFFTPYYFVWHTEYLVSLQSETSKTNPFFLLFHFTHIRFLFALFRFKAKFRDPPLEHRCAISGTEVGQGSKPVLTPSLALALHWLKILKKLFWANKLRALSQLELKYGYFPFWA